jgi:hypothetical protein
MVPSLPTPTSPVQRPISKPDSLSELSVHLSVALLEVTLLTTGLVGGDGALGTHWPEELQVSPPAHVPHDSVPKHPSSEEPHSRPCCAQVWGTQLLTHWPEALQVSPPGHVPHDSVLPHPSDACPHSTPAPWHVSGVHVPSHPQVEALQT